MSAIDTMLLRILLLLGCLFLGVLGAEDFYKVSSLTIHIYQDPKANLPPSFSE